MKKLVTLLILIGIGILFILFTYQTAPVRQDTPYVSPTIIPHTTPINTVDVDLGDEKIRISYFRLQDATTLTLIPNFDQKLSTSELIQEHRCVRGINGGFYDTNDKPLGYFQNDDLTIGTPIQNNLFNGYFLLSNEGRFDISNVLPQEINYRIILQSGPMLIASGQTLSLRIRDDEKARRSIVAISHTPKQLLFLILYNKDSIFSGPFLNDVPELLSRFSKSTGIVLASALNLDGGGASSFVTADTTLSELMYVGSFFCERSL